MGLLAEITVPERIREEIDRVLELAPEAIRSHVREAVVQTIEADVSARGDMEVTTEDMVRAIFKNTPEFYREGIAKRLSDLGVEAGLFAAPPKKDLTRMAEDIRRASAIAEVGFDPELVDRILHIYAANFAHPSVPVTFRTTTKLPEKRGLNVRYVDFWNRHDPYAMALSNGLIVRTGHPIDDLLPEMNDRFPVMGYGIDFGSVNGFEKIWPFLPPLAPQPTEKAYSLSSLPPAVRNNASFFSRFHLDRFGIFGVDYHNLSTNLYFSTGVVGKFAVERIVAMFEALDFAVPDQLLLEHCARASIFYPTFTWDSPKIERLCFGVLAHDSTAVPSHLHPVVEKYALGAPILGEKRKFIYSVTFGRQGNYIKIENDYSGSMVDLLSTGEP